jgi:peptidyl-prolyl cis-trans isomerase B (cyclophilin B)
MMIGMIAMQASCAPNKPAPNPTATFELTDGQKFVVELLPEYAPNTVNNFIAVASSGFYTGTVFHRVLPDLIIQGGGIFEDEANPGQYIEKDVGYSIKGEFSSNGFSANTLKHERGVISTARTNEPDSAGNQFFILLSEYPDWDGQYAAFGRVISGMETVEFVHDEYLKSYADGVPTVKSVTVDTFGAKWPDPEVIELPQ